jgi:hypothetical protein
MWPSFGLSQEYRGVNIPLLYPVFLHGYHEFIFFSHRSNLLGSIIRLRVHASALQTDKEDLPQMNFSMFLRGQQVLKWTSKS